MPKDQDNFLTFVAPDITQVNPKQTTKFSTSGKVPSYRSISQGFNIEGKCKNKQCEAYQKLVWTNHGYKAFQIGEIVRKSECPSCGIYTKGNKMFGIFMAQLTGYGLKASSSTTVDTDDEDSQIENKQITFPKIIHNEQGSFLKMDGKNGKLVQWYYMNLTIKKLK